MKLFAVLLLFIMAVGASFAPMDALGRLSNTHIVSDLTEVPKECNVLKENVRPARSIPGLKNVNLPLLDREYHVVSCPAGVHPGPHKVNIHKTRN